MPETQAILGIKQLRTPEQIAERVTDFEDDHEFPEGVRPLNTDFFRLQRLRAAERK